MKKISKRLASLLCAVLALTMLLPAAFAAEPVTVALSSVSGQPGQTVTVDVTISEKSNAGNGSMIVNYDPAKLEFVSFKAGAFGGLAEGGLYQENGKAVPGKISIAFMVSGTLQEKATIGQITFKILNDSGSIPLKLEMRELVAYTPDGTETDLMDTVKTENASVSIKAPTTAPATTKPPQQRLIRRNPRQHSPLRRSPLRAPRRKPPSTPARARAHPLLHALHWPQQPAPCSSSPARKRARKRNAFAPLHTCPFSLRPAGGAGLSTPKSGMATGQICPKVMPLPLFRGLHLLEHS